MSDRMPEDMPDRMPEDLPDRMPEDMPEHMPEDMPDRMPEDMADRMPEDLPVRKCINVMVGITRRKVIFCFGLSNHPRLANSLVISRFLFRVYHRTLRIEKSTIFGSLTWCHIGQPLFKKWPWCGSK